MYPYVLAGLLLISSSVCAQSPDSEPAGMAEQRSLRVLRSEYQSATDTLFDALNAAIDDDDYKIECRDYVPTGSRVRHRVCDHPYARALQRAATQRSFEMGGLTPGGSFDNSAVRVGSRGFDEAEDADSALIEKIVVAINENTEVRDAFMDFLAKQRALNAVLQADSGAEN